MEANHEKTCQELMVGCQHALHHQVMPGISIFFIIPPDVARQMYENDEIQLVSRETEMVSPRTTLRTTPRCRKVAFPLRRPTHEIGSHRTLSIISRGERHRASEAQPIVSENRRTSTMIIRSIPTVDAAAPALGLICYDHDHHQNPHHHDHKAIEHGTNAGRDVDTNETDDTNGDQSHDRSEEENPGCNGSLACPLETDGALATRSVPRGDPDDVPLDTSRHAADADSDSPSATAKRHRVGEEDGTEGDKTKDRTEGKQEETSSFIAIGYDAENGFDAIVGSGSAVPRLARTDHEGCTACYTARDGATNRHGKKADAMTDEPPAAKRDIVHSAAQPARADRVGNNNVRSEDDHRDADCDLASVGNGGVLDAGGSEGDASHHPDDNTRDSARQQHDRPLIEKAKAANEKKRTRRRNKRKKKKKKQAQDDQMSVQRKWPDRAKYRKDLPIAARHRIENGPSRPIHLDHDHQVGEDGADPDHGMTADASPTHVLGSCHHLATTVQANDGVRLCQPSHDEDDSEPEDMEGKKKEPEDMEGEKNEPEDMEGEKNEPENMEGEKNEPEDMEREKKESEDMEHKKKESEDMEHEEKEPEDIEHDEKESENVEHDEKESENVEHDEKEPEDVEHDEKEPEDMEHEEKEPEDMEHEEKESENMEHDEKESENMEHDEKESENMEHEEKESENMEHEEKEPEDMEHKEKEPEDMEHEENVPVDMEHEEKVPVDNEPKDGEPEDDESEDDKTVGANAPENVVQIRTLTSQCMKDEARSDLTQAPRRPRANDCTARRASFYREMIGVVQAKVDGAKGEMPHQSTKERERQDERSAPTRTPPEDNAGRTLLPVAARHRINATDAAYSYPVREGANRKKDESRKDDEDEEDDEVDNAKRDDVEEEEEEGKKEEDSDEAHVDCEIDIESDFGGDGSHAEWTEDEDCAQCNAIINQKRHRSRRRSKSLSVKRRIWPIAAKHRLCVSSEEEKEQEEEEEREEEAEQEKPCRHRYTLRRPNGHAAAAAAAPAATFPCPTDGSDGGLRVRPRRDRAGRIAGIEARSRDGRRVAQRRWYESFCADQADSATYGVPIDPAAMDAFEPSFSRAHNDDGEEKARSLPRLDLTRLRSIAGRSTSCHLVDPGQIGSASSTCVAARVVARAPTHVQEEGEEEGPNEGGNNLADDRRAPYIATGLDHSRVGGASHRDHDIGHGGNENNAGGGNDNCGINEWGEDANKEKRSVSFDDACSADIRSASRTSSSSLSSAFSFSTSLSSCSSTASSSSYRSRSASSSLSFSERSSPCTFSSASSSSSSSSTWSSSTPLSHYDTYGENDGEVAIETDRIVDWIWDASSPRAIQRRDTARPVITCAKCHSVLKDGRPCSSGHSLPSQHPFDTLCQPNNRESGGSAAGKRQDDTNDINDANGANDKKDTNESVDGVIGQLARVLGISNYTVILTGDYADRRVAIQIEARALPSLCQLVQNSSSPPPLPPSDEAGCVSDPRPH